MTEKKKRVLNLDLFFHGGVLDVMDGKSSDGKLKTALSFVWEVG